VAVLSPGALTAALGNLVTGQTYAATVVGVCADGTRTPPSAPALFTPVAPCKPTLAGIGANFDSINAITSYLCPAAPRAVLVLKCVAGSAGACGAAAVTESPAAAPPGGVVVTTESNLSLGTDYSCFTVARNADGSGAICSDRVTVTTTASSCFPAAATVQVRGRGAVRMEALRVGDAVLSVGHAGVLEFQDVYFFGRRQRDAPAQPGAPQAAFAWYHAIQAVASLSSAPLDLRVSSSHFVPVSLDAAGWCNASAAGRGGVAPPAWASHTMLVGKDVKPGMVLWHVAPGSDAVGGAPSPACVTANRDVLEYGAYVPYVRARAIVVDSVAASPHIRWKAFALNWQVAHALYVCGCGSASSWLTLLAASCSQQRVPPPALPLVAGCCPRRCTSPPPPAKSF
jgi:hypothetical protein